jgi:hypothetical protein
MKDKKVQGMLGKEGGVLVGRRKGQGIWGRGKGGGDSGE